jgi:hypothetical protein
MVATAGNLKARQPITTVTVYGEEEQVAGLELTLAQANRNHRKRRDSTTFADATRGRHNQELTNIAHKTSEGRAQ